MTPFIARKRCSAGSRRATTAPRASSAFASACTLANPFVTATTLRFALRSAGAVRLEVFDVRGRRTQMLQIPRLLPGNHVLEWNGRDAQGRGVVPGIYFCRLCTPDGERRGKIVRSRAGSR